VRPKILVNLKFSDKVWISSHLGPYCEWVFALRRINIIVPDLSASSGSSRQLTSIRMVNIQYRSWYTKFALKSIFVLPTQNVVP